MGSTQEEIFSEIQEAVVVIAHEPDPKDQDRLPLAVGDIVVVVEEDHKTGWSGGHLRGAADPSDNRWFPSNCVRRAVVGAFVERQTPQEEEERAPEPHDEHQEEHQEEDQQAQELHQEHQEEQEPTQLGFSEIQSTISEDTMQERQTPQEEEERAPEPHDEHQEEHQEEEEQQQQAGELQREHQEEHEPTQLVVAEIQSTISEDTMQAASCVQSSHSVPTFAINDADVETEVEEEVGVHQVGEDQKELVRLRRTNEDLNEENTFLKQKLATSESEAATAKEDHNAALQEQIRALRQQNETLTAEKTSLQTKLADASKCQQAEGSCTENALIEGLQDAAVALSLPSALTSLQVLSEVEKCAIFLPSCMTKGDPTEFVRKFRDAMRREDAVQRVSEASVLEAKKEAIFWMKSCHPKGDQFVDEGKVSSQTGLPDMYRIKSENDESRKQLLEEAAQDKAAAARLAEEAQAEGANAESLETMRSSMVAPLETAKSYNEPLDMVLNDIQPPGCQDMMSEQVLEYILKQVSPKHRKKSMEWDAAAAIEALGKELFLERPQEVLATILEQGAGTREGWEPMKLLQKLNALQHLGRNYAAFADEIDGRAARGHDILKGNEAVLKTIRKLLDSKNLHVDDLKHKLNDKESDLFEAFQRFLELLEEVSCLQVELEVEKDQQISLQNDQEKASADVANIKIVLEEVDAQAAEAKALSSQQLEEVQMLAKNTQEASCQVLEKHIGALFKHAKLHQMLLHKLADTLQETENLAQKRIEQLDIKKAQTESVNVFKINDEKKKQEDILKKATEALDKIESERALGTRNLVEVEEAASKLPNWAATTLATLEGECETAIAREFSEYKNPYASECASASAASSCSSAAAAGAAAATAGTTDIMAPQVTPAEYQEILEIVMETKQQLAALQRAEQVQNEEMQTLRNELDRERKLKAQREEAPLAIENGETQEQQQSGESEQPAVEQLPATATETTTTTTTTTTTETAAATAEEVAAVAAATATTTTTAEDEEEPTAVEQEEDRQTEMVSEENKKAEHDDRDDDDVQEPKVVAATAASSAPAFGVDDEEHEEHEEKVVEHATKEEEEQQEGEQVREVHEVAEEVVVEEVGGFISPRTEEDMTSWTSVEAAELSTEDQQASWLPNMPQMPRMPRFWAQNEGVPNAEAEVDVPAEPEVVAEQEEAQTEQQ